MPTRIGKQAMRQDRGYWGDQRPSCHEIDSPRHVELGKKKRPLKFYFVAERPAGGAMPRPPRCPIDYAQSRADAFRSAATWRRLYREAGAVSPFAVYVVSVGFGAAAEAA